MITIYIQYWTPTFSDIVIGFQETWFCARLVVLESSNTSLDFVAMGMMNTRIQHQRHPFWKPITRGKNASYVIDRHECWVWQTFAWMTEGQGPGHEDVCFQETLKSSNYCICAMGYEVNSSHLVESVYICYISNIEP